MKIDPDDRSRLPRGFFITGTDTGVGKTVVACALLHALGRRGLRVIGMKPVAAGVEREGARLVYHDVASLMAAGNVHAPEDIVNPYRFEPAIAPHIAAAQAGALIEISRLQRAHSVLAAQADCVIVEGAGGFRVPLGPEHDMADLALALRSPVILVVGMRLGCINHALLTAAAIRVAGLTFAGWVANHIDPHMASPDENVHAIAARIGAPLLARISHASHVDARSMAAALDIDLLCTV